jgi:hypothetical protein
MKKLIKAGLLSIALASNQFSAKEVTGQVWLDKMYSEFNHLSYYSGNFAHSKPEFSNYEFPAKINWNYNKNTIILSKEEENFNFSYKKVDSNFNHTNTSKRHRFSTSPDNPTLEGLLEKDLYVKVKDDQLLAGQAKINNLKLKLSQDLINFIYENLEDVSIQVYGSDRVFSYEDARFGKLCADKNTPIIEKKYIPSQLKGKIRGSDVEFKSNIYFKFVNR